MKFRRSEEAGSAEKKAYLYRTTLNSTWATIVQCVFMCA